MTKMPKQLSKHFLLFVLLLFGTLLISCENEEDLLEEVTPTYNEELPISIVTTTFEEAGEKFNQLSRQHHLESQMRLISFGGIEKSGSSGGIVIISEEVKEIKRGDYTSYTMLIEPKDIASNIFYNLTIEDVKGVTKLFITKYDPTDAWLENNNMRFEGQITTFRIDDLQTALDRIDTPIMTGTEGGGGNTTYPTDCNGSVIATVIVTEFPCPCEGHRVGEYCEGCSIGAYPYNEYKTVYECVGGNPFENPPGGTPGSTDPPTGGPGGGSGAGTTPTSPAGNDPSLTAPIPPKDGASNDAPCKKLKEYETDALIKETLVDLKQIADNDDVKYEVGVAAKKVGNGWGFDTVVGTENNPYVAMSLEEGVKIDIFMHNHFIGGLSIFSVHDLVMFHTVLNGYSANGTDLVFIVVTNAGTRYAIKVNNIAKFNAVANQHFLDEAKLEKFIDDNFKYVNKEQDNITNEKEFLQAIKNVDLGLSLFSANEDFTQWKELTIDPANEDIVLPKDCN